MLFWSQVLLEQELGPLSGERSMPAGALGVWHVGFPHGRQGPRWEAVMGGSLPAWSSEATLHTFLHMDCSTVGLCVGAHSLLV